MGKPLDLLDMTDEDFSKLSGPPEVEEPETPVEAAAEEPAPSPLGSPEAETPESEEAAEDPAEVEEETPEAEDPVPAKAVAEETPAASPDTPEKPVTAEAEKPTASLDYEAFYKQVMTPFRANGKLIQLQTPEEAVQLMQMGANYTKKMQGIQKHKKFLVMLENNELLDEQRLSFLIDLDKKNPEAIKQLLKDARIDPLELDTSEESKYQNGSHVVTDQEANVHSAIEDLKLASNGMVTLQSIQRWDQDSKNEVWKNPEILQIIHTQREAGIYDLITDEMERQQALGKLSINTPFLQTYRQIGDILNAQGAFANLQQPATSAPAPVPGRAPVAVKAQKPAQTTASDTQKVRAAAPPRSSPTKPKSGIDILGMDDDEFLKLSKLAGKI